MRSAGEASPGQTPEPGVVLARAKVAFLLPLPLAVRAVLTPPRPLPASLQRPHLLAAVLVPGDLLRLDAQYASARPAATREFGRHERADVDADAVVDSWLPADGLLVERLPAHEDVARWLAGHDLRQLVLQVLRRRQPAIRSLNALVPVRFLTPDPLSEIPVRQRLQCAPTLSVRTRETVVVHQRVKPVTAPVPDVPDERPLLKSLAMLLEKAIAQPRFDRLDCPGRSSGGNQKLPLLRRRPLGAVNGGEKASQAVRRRGLATHG